MKMMWFKIIFALLIGFNLTRAYDVTSTCKLVKNETYIADPTSCNAWAYCVNGEIQGRGYCNQGLYYNARNGECDYVNNVDCQFNLETMCKGLDKIFKSNPNDCSQYCYCLNGQPICKKCPDNQVFNNEKMECVWKDGDDNKCMDNSPCQLVANNQFIKNEKHCSNYYLCLNGKHFEGKCDDGQNFNYLQGRCDWEKIYKCSSSTSSSPSKNPQENQPKPKPKPETCSISSINLESFYVSDGQTCRGSFYCKSKNDPVPYWTQCPINTHFHYENQTCIDSVNSKCPYDRCDGFLTQFVTVLNSNCKNFVFCQNGKIVSNSENYCKNLQYPYFDEITQACVPEKPNYEICD